MDNKKFEVVSKYNGYLTITEANTNIKRIWPRLGDKLMLSLDTIQAIIATPGGRKILENYLIVPQEALKAVDMVVGPEYFYTADDIKELLNKGSIEQLDDALTFAPQGTVDLIRETAVQMRITDRNKIALIKEKTGYDIQSQIDLYGEIYETPVEEAKERKADVFKPADGAPAKEVAKAETPAAPVRKYRPVVQK